MKRYHVVDGSQGWEIASGLEAAEAIRVRDEYESKGGMNEACIFDEDGNTFDADYELELFVDSLMEYPSEELTEMTYEDATVNLEGYRACGMEIPEGLDEGMLCFLWNRALKAPDPVEPDLPDEESKPTALEIVLQAAQDRLETLNSYGYVDKDLEDAIQTLTPAVEDTQLKALQTTLDYAYSRRDDEWKALEAVRENGPDFLLDQQYRNYCGSQAFLEGVTMAIFAAGYTLSIKDTKTGRSTVCKH